MLVMGVLNITPDSFYDGGRYTSAEDAVERGLRMAQEGADIIDIGGESTRPGSRAISASEELERVLPVIEGVHRRSDVLLSVDTTKASVAEEAIACGASIVNDISALRFDHKMAAVIGKGERFVILMHMLGTPETMQIDPSYVDPVSEIKLFLAERIDAAVRAGIEREKIIVDPGIGFGKRLKDNLAILMKLTDLTDLEAPVMIGLSRKSFFGRLLDLPAGERLEATIAANAIAIANGADIIRVHDVKEGRRTADVAFRLRHDHH